MPTGLTADIYEGKSTSLRAFALNCARQLGGCYQASDYGNKMLPMDKPPVMEPSPYHREQLKRAKEKLAYWLELKNNPEKMKQVYDAEQSLHQAENIGHDARMKVVKERYETMISRVKQWKVPEEYASLKALMLEQLHKSLEDDYHPEWRPWKGEKPIGEWMEHNISMAGRDIEYHTAELEKEKQAIAEINAYVKGLYDLLDEVEPYNEED